MVDLGQYAVPVLSAYGGTIALIIGLVALSIWRSRRVKRQLAVVEARQANGAQL